jgi:hypothetical protein
MHAAPKGWTTLLAPGTGAEVPDSEFPMRIGDHDIQVGCCWRVSNDAREKALMLDGSRHLVHVSQHPSPLAAYRGFFGSRPFSKTNAFLASQGLEPIDWRLE